MNKGLGKKISGIIAKARAVFGLVGLSIAALIVIELYFGDVAPDECIGECESLYSSFAWVLGFFLLIVAVILLAALVGWLYSKLVSRQRAQKDLTSFYLSEAPTEDPDKK